MADLKEILAGGKNQFDLTNPENQLSVNKMAEAILRFDADLSSQELIRSNTTPLEAKIALHLARSKSIVQQIVKPVRIAIVFAMWGEQNRLYPRSEANPNGEDSLRVKIDQLNWLCANSPVEWTLYAVDDGCPHGSGKIANKILTNHPEKSRVRVLFLEEALPAADGPLKQLKSANDSRKGGAIIYGASEALKSNCDAVIYTDADNSVHLGQIGLLLEHFVNHDFKVVLGNRKDPSAVLVKQENRWGKGIKLLRHMQRMVGQAIFTLGILDSQAAFKLYEANLLRKIIAEPSVFDFSFDSDWIAASIVQGEHFAKVPFAFIDSFAESASIVQGPMTTWETLLMGLINVVEQRGLAHNTSMAKVLKEEIESSEDLDLLIDSLPSELEHATDNQLGDPDIMSPEAIQEWIRTKKSER